MNQNKETQLISLLLIKKKKKKINKICINYS